MSLNKPKPIKGAQNAAGYIVTANDLMSGEVVYLAQDPIWSQQPQTAVIFEDAEAAQAKAKHLKISIMRLRLSALTLHQSKMTAGQ